MAFEKSLSLASGVAATYWRITHADLNFDAAAVHVWVRGYPTAEASAARAEPLPGAAYAFVVPAAALPGGTVDGVTRAGLYAAVRAVLDAGGGVTPEDVGAAPLHALAGAADA